MSDRNQHFKLVFFVPTPAVDTCKAAIFDVGAGKYPGTGGYTECCFVTKGTGQFRPGEKCNPTIGKVGEMEHVEEMRVEMLCVGREVTEKAVEALKRAHPYEEPAYEVHKLEEI